MTKKGKREEVLVVEAAKETTEETPVGVDNAVIVDGDVVKKEMIRTAVRSFYDAQNLRIQSGQRIVANTYVKLGIQPGQKKEDASEESLKFLKVILNEYDLIADGLSMPSNRAKVKAIEEKSAGIITNSFEYDLISSYKSLQSNEESLKKSIAYLLEDYPIYTEFLKEVKGCGPLMSAVIISELNPYNARHASSFCKYAGLDVVINEDGNGEGRSKKSNHLVEMPYVNKKGEACTKMSITYNPFLKSKLVGVLGGSFLKSKAPYAQAYYNYKFRLQNRPDLAEATPKHIHNMAIRYMVKMFLQDLWAKWRKLEGLEVTVPYAVAKLGMAPHGSDLTVQERIQAITDANIAKIESTNKRVLKEA